MEKKVADLTKSKKLLEESVKYFKGVISEKGIDPKAHIFDIDNKSCVNMDISMNSVSDFNLDELDSSTASIKTVKLENSRKPSAPVFPFRVST